MFNVNEWDSVWGSCQQHERGNDRYVLGLEKLKKDGINDGIKDDYFKNVCIQIKYAIKSCPRFNISTIHVILK